MGGVIEGKGTKFVGREKRLRVGGGGRKGYLCDIRGVGSINVLKDPKAVTITLRINHPIGVSFHLPASTSPNSLFLPFTKLPPSQVHIFS